MLLNISFGYFKIVMKFFLLYKKINVQAVMWNSWIFFLYYMLYCDFFTFHPETSCNALMMITKTDVPARLESYLKVESLIFKECCVFHHTLFFFLSQLFILDFFHSILPLFCVAVFCLFFLCSMQFKYLNKKDI